MVNSSKTKEQLLKELTEMRLKMSEIQKALLEAERRGRSIFEDSPAPLWEADFSALKQEIDRLRTSEAKDLPSYLRSHPETLRDLVSRIRIIGINKAALKLHEARDEKQVTQNLDAVIVHESHDLLAHQFFLIAAGATGASLEGSTATLDGERRFVRVRWVVLPGYESTFARVLVSVADLTARKRMEDDLLESEEKFRLLFEKSPDAVLLMQGDTCIECNEGALKLRHCTSKDQIVGHSVSAFAAERQPDGTLSSEKARQEHEILMRDGFNRFEWMGPVFDGKPSWAEVSQTLIPVHGREITYTVARDIGERKEAEARLRESEERYRIAIEHSNDAVAIVRGEKHLYVNRRFLEMFGYDRLEEVVGKKQSLLVHPDDQAMVAEYSRRRQSGGTAPSRYEFKGIRRDGTTIYGEASAAVITYLGEAAVLSYFRDVTERRRAEEALRESEERYRSVVELSPTGILIHVDGVIHFANRAWARMVGVESTEEPLGKPVLDFIHPDSVDIIRERIRTIAARKTLNPLLEHRLVKTDGSVTEVATIAVPFTYRGREGVMVFVEDITERKRAEEVLKAREKELEAKSTSLEEANTALRVLLKHREEDKKTLEKTILANVKELVFPYLEKLRQTNMSDHQRAYLSVIESSLNEVVSPFLQRLTNVYSHFTPMEVQVANLIKEGKTTKEVSDFLNISGATVHTHRDNIRRKLGLSKKKMNLQTYLRSLLQY